MIIDAKIDYKNKKLILIKSDGDYEERDLINPYFYAIIPRGKGGVLERIIGGEDAWLEETRYIPIIYKGTRYDPDPNYTVYKVYTTSPTLVPRISESLRKFNIRISASNLRYIIRNTFDLNIHFFDTTPLYYGFDPGIIENLRRIKGLVIDIEAVGGKPVLASLYWWTPYEEIKKDDIISLKLPEQQDELQKLLNRASLIIGHNIVGFDIPVLKRSSLFIDELTKSIFDTSLLLATYGNSLKVGSARSLLDVATILKEDAKIDDDELNIKRNAKGRIDKMSWDELVKYNQNDITLTAKLLNIFYPFVAVVSSITQIPVSEVLTLPSGMVAEYFLLRFIELLGYVPEYRPVSARLEGERVFLASEGKEYENVIQTDVKMMYPSFVSYYKIDPTLHIGDEKFDRMAGLGVVYSAVKRLIKVRLMSKKLRKQDDLYKPLDSGIKAVLNALAYGVQGKKSGLTILGNDWCPSRIFYGTREAQFKTIEYLKSKGYKVIYSDTDSFFIAFDKKPSEEDIKKLVETINNYIGKWGLEVDLEDVWLSMYIYRKKNYILQKKDYIILKGSALRNLDRYYTPECVNLHELLKISDKKERLQYIKEAIESAPIEDLFIRGHQQIWRLIGKDIQSWKRLGDRKDRYMRVLTPWQEKPTLILKKARGGQLLIAHSNPIFTLFLDGNNEVDVGELNPFNIVELRSLKIDGELRRIKSKYSVGDLLIFTDSLYTLYIDKIQYGIQMGGKLRYIDMWYEGTYPSRPIGILKSLRASLQVKKINIDEEILRTCVYLETVKTIRRYGLL